MNLFLALPSWSNIYKDQLWHFYPDSQSPLLVFLKKYDAQLLTH